jgi:hypothetical protein
LVAAGIGYLVDSLASLLADGYGGILAAILVTPAVLGEVGLTLWLLVKGIPALGQDKPPDSKARAETSPAAGA